MVRKATCDVGEWCIDGDFNAIKRSEERKRTSSVSNRVELREFRKFITNLDLVDAPLHDEGKFSWYKTNGSAMSRPDIFLASDGLIDS